MLIRYQEQNSSRLTLDAESFEPAYREIHRSGELRHRSAIAYEILKDCRVCPRHCEVDRTDGELGICLTGDRPVVSSYFPHMGEETPLVGLHGSGTIFFTSCNLRCLYCQNYDISQLRQGQEVSVERLGEMMLELQALGCHNINFVTPSHMVPQILAGVAYAASRGLRVPLVYNTSGYDDLETLRLLDGVIDLYMPDTKYAAREAARRYSKAPDYPEVMREAIREMHRQVGDLKTDTGGIALRGLLVRHLLLPGGLAGTREILRFLAREISVDTYVNLMDQYHPSYRAFDLPELNRRITRDEHQEAIAKALEEGLWRIDGMSG